MLERFSSLLFANPWLPFRQLLHICHKRNENSWGPSVNSNSETFVSFIIKTIISSQDNASNF